MSREPILEISGLTTVFHIADREIVAVRDLDLAVATGETVALVGESGSGKSVTSLSIMGLLPRGVGRIAAGTLRLRRKTGESVDLHSIGGEALRRVRGNDIGMVFQEPLTSLNPVYTVGEQIAEPIRIHLGKSRREIEETVRKIEKIETALESKFQEHFVNAMAMPNKVDAFPKLSEVVTLPERKVMADDGEGGGRRRRRGRE
ncbi:ATP-binding cassette domain-containing protein [Sinorhizobium sp. 6-117]|uniref:ATP-binding cassette domain-containing protein n=1 Tax=Sinorhizobium sp. 6-117 TaxID=3049090 RepID=UPI0024C23976|nr:ATP-binding cassette domain-containing protein [Sinorhizobium sp. 6-117]MDK1479136.1 ATP-binding cassette domain-containing protein [Sinorhizobium sp. 6-117]